MKLDEKKKDNNISCNDLDNTQMKIKNQVVGNDFNGCNLEERKDNNEYDNDKYKKRFI